MLFDVAERIVLNVEVPAGGYLYAACSVPTNGTIINVVYGGP